MTEGQHIHEVSGDKSTFVLGCNCFVPGALALQKLSKRSALLIFQHPSRSTKALNSIVCEDNYQRLCKRLGLPTVPSVASCFAAGILGVNC